MFKIRILLVIIFIAVAIAGYFSTQPVAQIGPNAAPGDCDPIAFDGFVTYFNSNCEWRDSDKMHLYKWNGTSWVYLFAIGLSPTGHTLQEARYGFLSELVPGADTYRIVPDITLAGSSGVSPAYRIVTWNGCNVALNLNYDVTVCVQQ